MKILDYIKINNKAHILLAVLLPLWTMFSHSIGHDEWHYFLELYQANPQGFIDPPYRIIINLQELMQIPRYLLGFFYLDFLQSFTHIPIFWIYAILFIVPNIILFPVCLYPISVS